MQRGISHLSLDAYLLFLIICIADSPKSSFSSISSDSSKLYGRLGRASVLVLSPYRDRREVSKKAGFPQRESAKKKKKSLERREESSLSR